jgi:hypothetical protein
MKSKITGSLMICLFLPAAIMVMGQEKINFTFQVNKNAITSAGVFSKTGVLVKTLWSGVFYKAGVYTREWDGRDEDGRLVKVDGGINNGGYEIHLLSNNIKYQWEGVVGNTSSALSGPAVHHALQGMYGLAFAGINGYYCTNYNEQQPPLFTFNIHNPQSKTSVLDKGGCTAFVTTDGNYVYWDCMDSHDRGRTFVYATKVSDNSEVTNFSNGIPVQVTYARKYVSAIDTSHSVDSQISGMAVQKKGNYLFVSHLNAHQVHVLNKTTGALVRMVPVTSPGGLAVDNTNHLWVITGNKISKYTVNTDGSLTAALTLSGFAAPLAVAVSTDGSTVVIADGGTSQQLKAFSNPAVTDDKFYFADLHSGARTFIAFAPDGSFWLGDPGNCRTLHFSTGRTLIDRIMFLPAFYSSVVDPNNPTRVFADFLEFSVDYSKNLSPANGSWKLVRNWGYKVPREYNDIYYRFRYLTTLSNGRTYAFLRHKGLALVELASTSGLRYTGIVLPSLNEELLKDGSLLLASDFSAGKPTKWIKKPLTGFDGSGNPIWGTPVVIATSPPATMKDPLHLANTVLTSSDILVSFDGGIPPNGSGGYHLGGIKVGDTSWLWRTAASTFKEYTGPYPATGAFDIGNGVRNAGSYARALDNTIIWGYHGEFWKGSQVNKWNHFYQDGLFLGQFGIALSKYPEADSLMAGNAFAVSFVKDTRGNGYVYLNDESYHSGIHRWKVTGLATITEQRIPVAATAKQALNYSTH